MFKFIQILCYSLPVMFFTACNTSSSISEIEITELEEPQELFVKTKEEYSNFLQAIVGTDSIGFRGVLPSMSMNEIRGVETATHEETDSLIVRFMIEDGIEQNAELEYYFRTDSIFDHIEVTVYNSSTAQRDSLFTDLYVYLTSNFKTNFLVDSFTYEVDSLSVLLKKGGTSEFPNIFVEVSPQP